VHRSILSAAVAAAAVFAALLIAPAANAQLAICSRVTPPPAYCNEEPPDEPPPLVVPPPAPTEFVATSSTYNSVSLAWIDRANDERGYRITRLVNGVWTVVGQLPSNVGNGGRMAFTDTGLESSHPYDYRLELWNVAGPTLSSIVTVSTTAPAPPPPPPVEAPPKAPVLTASASSTRTATLTWTATNGATGYAVERRPSGGGFAEVSRLTSSARSVVDGGLTYGTRYDYRVKALGVDPTVELSNVATIQTLAPQVTRVTLHGRTPDPFAFEDWTFTLPSGATILNVRNVAVDENRAGLNVYAIKHTAGLETRTVDKLVYNATTSAFNGQLANGTWNLRVGDTSAVFLWDCPYNFDPNTCSSRASITLDMTWA
jgi:fibronectin type III domain protein